MNWPPTSHNIGMYKGDFCWWIWSFNWIKFTTVIWKDMFCELWLNCLTLNSFAGDKFVTLSYPVKINNLYMEFIKMFHVFQALVSRSGNSDIADFIWSCSWENNASSASNNGPHRNSYIYCKWTPGPPCVQGE